VASTIGKIRFCLTLAAAALCTKTSYWHTGEWRYYLFVVGSLLVALALSWPGHREREKGDETLIVLESVPSLN
jgi:hypothetical protein